MPEQCGNCSVCCGEPFEVDTGRAKQLKAAEARAITREERRMRKEAARLMGVSAEDGMSAWERALLENLKTLRALLAAQRHAPAYTVFSDASLRDMVKKRPADMDAFLDVSGVGLAKLEKYGRVFLAVIHEGQEPNEAFAAYLEEEKPARPKGKAAVGKGWTEQEEKLLRDEFESELPMAEIARRHERNPGGIKARLKKLGLME